MMTIRKKLATLAASVGLAISGVIALGAPAHAGSNGQQILFIDNTYNAASIHIWGTSYNGYPADGCFNTTAFQNPIAGWWWKGDVSVIPYTNADCTGFAEPTAHSTVQQSSSTDWWAVVDGNLNPANEKQIEFFDNWHKANSIYISGTNQTPAHAEHCVATPGFDTIDYNWWFRGTADITTFASGDCSGPSNGSYEVYVNGPGATSTFGVTD